MIDLSNKYFQTRNDLKNKLVVSKDGKISYSCLIDDLDEQEKILHKAINHTKEIKALREKYSR